MNRYLLLFLHTISLVLLGFGWLLNMLSLEVRANFIVNISLFSEKKSVFSMLRSLWETGNYFPFVLIFFFGIIIPLIKSGFIFYLLLAKKPVLKWLTVIAAINKWAMADVFAISIFVAFLGAGAMQNTSAVLQPGFYCFAAYVLMSGIITIFLRRFLQTTMPSNI